MDGVSRQLSVGFSLAVGLSLLFAVSPVAGYFYDGCETADPDFYAEPTSGYAPLEVAFYDTTTTEVVCGSFWQLPDRVSDYLFQPEPWPYDTPNCEWTVEWDFGDGHTVETSPGENPVHVYTASGQYTVSLTYSERCYEWKLEGMTVLPSPPWTRRSHATTETMVDYIKVLARHPTEAVGGEAYPVPKSGLLAPWIAVSLFLAATTTCLVRRRAQD